MATPVEYPAWYQNGETRRCENCGRYNVPGDFKLVAYDAAHVPAVALVCECGYAAWSQVLYFETTPAAEDDLHTPGSGILEDAPDADSLAVMSLAVNRAVQWHFANLDNAHNPASNEDLFSDICDEVREALGVESDDVWIRATRDYLAYLEEQAAIEDPADTDIGNDGESLHAAEFPEGGD